jgi:hypothetical protein
MVRVEEVRVRRGAVAIYILLPGRRTGAYSLSCGRTIYLTYGGELVLPGKLRHSRRQLVLAVAFGAVRRGPWRVAVVASQVEHVSITFV